MSVRLKLLDLFVPIPTHNVTKERHKQVKDKRELMGPMIDKILNDGKDENMSIRIDLCAENKIIELMDTVAKYQDVNMQLGHIICELTAHIEAYPERRDDSNEL